MISEQEFLQLVDSCFPESGSQGLLLGRGDDCAVWSRDQEMCITSDLFLEDVHFRKQYFRAADIGDKALAVNISDIAAMGAQPQGFNLCLMLPQDLGLDFWQELLQGMAELARAENVVLCGGDLSRSSILGLDITIWGRAMGAEFLRRGQCRPGDILFCAGSIGLARVGLQVLESGQCRTNYPAACQAHLRPGIRIPQAEVLAKEPRVRGLMDVSDGLARDLPRFLGPGQGVDIFLQHEDLHQEVLDYAQEKGLDSLEQALLGGEDYALLGCIDSQGMPALQHKLPEAIALGRVLDRPGLWLQNRELLLSGFDHFSK